MAENLVFDEIIKKSERRPTLPGIALKLIEEGRKQHPRHDEIIKLISSDPPLSAEILKCVNSPLYGLGTKVTSIEHSVNMLALARGLPKQYSLVLKEIPNNTAWY